MNTTVSEHSLPALNPPTLRLALCVSPVVAGFPSPAEDYVEARLDLNEYLIEHKEATFFMRVKGDSMRGAKIFDGDILVVDRSCNPVHGSIVVAIVNGDLTVKRLYRRAGVVKLCAANPEFADILLKEDSDMVIWGVVKSVIRKL